MKPTIKRDAYPTILGLVLLILLLASFYLPAQVHAQVQMHAPVAPATSTITPKPIVLTNLKPSGSKTIKLSNTILKTLVNLDYKDEFSASFDLQSPPSMMIGESRVITLIVTPSQLAEAAFLQARLTAVTFRSADDGQAEKRAVLNQRSEWSWSIAPETAGEQEFFINISYRTSDGSDTVHWQNIAVKLTVLTQPTPQPNASPTDTPTHTIVPSSTIAPTLTSIPTETNTPRPTETPTATKTTGQKMRTSFEDNPAPYVTAGVTLLLGLLGFIFQSARKK